jgi:thiol-disulfide isomerase/thioredoxin
MKFQAILWVVFLFIALPALSQQCPYCHYLFTRSISGYTSTGSVKDTIECFYKSGLRSEQKIFLKDKLRNNAWYFIHDSVFYFTNGSWKYSLEDYGIFYLKANKMLFPPLIDNGISYKKYLNDPDVISSSYISTFYDQVYKNLVLSSIAKVEGMDSFHLEIKHKNEFPVKYKLFALVKPVIINYEAEILQIDSGLSTKVVLDSLESYLDAFAKEETLPVLNKTISPAPDTLKLIEDFIQIAGLPQNGKIIVVDIWYRSCAPCLRSIPSLNLISKQQDIFVAGLNMTDENENETRLAMQKYPCEFKLIFDSASVLKKLNIMSFPTLIVYNPENKKIKLVTGFNEEDNFNEIQRAINQVR